MPLDCVRSWHPAQYVLSPHAPALALNRVRFSWLPQVLGYLFLVSHIITTAQAQKLSNVIPLTQIPADGMLLKDGWHFQGGDIPNGASPQLDDHQWRSIDPTKEIRDLPQLQQAGSGWLRLHLRTGPDLPPLMIKVYQSVASEMYLDGRLLYRFGTVSTNPDRVQAYDPRATFSFPIDNSSEHVLALHIACQPGPYYRLQFLHWNTTALEYWLFSSSAMPTLKSYDIREIYLSTFKIGIAFILFVLHLSLFFAYRTQRTNLYAASMYLLLCITFSARAAADYTHSLAGRLLVNYGSLIDIWIPAIALLTLYSLFGFRKGWPCWVAIGSISLIFIPLPAAYQWVSILGYSIQFDVIRLSAIAIQRNLLGARVVAAGAFFGLSLWIMGVILSALHITAAHHQWFFNLYYVVSFLCFPLTLSLWLALEHGWINRQLIVRLREVEDLSAQNLAQQRERQHLLAHQNEQLERQVTERTRELRQQADQLRQLDEAKSRFVTNITHEFRTPLTLILSPVETLQHHLTDTPYSKSLAMVHRNARQLLNLINQLMDLARLDAHFMTVDESRGELTDFVCQLVQPFAEQAHARQILFQFESGVQAAYWFDRDKLERIVVNLLANALKFTEPGGRISLTLSESDEIVLTVSDSGIGIAADQLPHIFDRFYRAKPAYSTHSFHESTGTSPDRGPTPAGTGIGLALVDELIALQGGKITVQSQPGQGTIFRVTLPYRRAAEATPVPPAEPASAPIGQLRSEEEPHVLLVEDNVELAGFIIDCLPAHYRIDQATNGQAGLAKALATVPDLIISDVMMPIMDGYALVDQLKTDGRTDHIPVILLTAKASFNHRLEGFGKGADDYLTKPFHVGELLVRVDNLLNRQRRLREHLQASLRQPQTMVPTNQAPIEENAFLDQLYAVLEDRLSDSSLNVEALSSHFQINRTNLHRKVKALTGLSIGELIRAYRLKRAANFLQQGANSSESAYRTGFDSPAYFTKCFRDQYGMTPTEFARTGLSRP